MTRSAPISASDMPPACGLSGMDLDSIPNPDRPRKLGDSRGLFLLVNPDGSRYWRVKYSFAGRPKLLSLGVYPQVDLAEARTLAADIRGQAADGIDPSQARKDEKARAKARAVQSSAVRAPTDFLLSAAGALIVELPARAFTLSPRETRKLRAFLAATTAVGAPRNGN